MTGCDMPSDQEFLEELLRNTISPHFNEMRDQLVKRAYEAIDEQIDKGIIDRQDRQKYLDIQLDAIDPIRVFQSAGVTSIKTRALDCLEEYRQTLQEVPVGALGATEFNAFAIRTPRGGAVIALNLSLWNSLKIIDFCMLAMIYRNTARPIGAHHSNEAYAQNFIAVVDAIKAGSIVILPGDGKHSIADCVGPAAPPDKFVALTLIFQLVFILLHEYGHIVCGHLDADLTRKAAVSGQDVDVYLTSHRQEFEADEFAIQRLVLSQVEEADRYHCITALTVLFLLFDVCEEADESRILGTHPASLDRLKNIHEIFIRIHGEAAESNIRDINSSLEYLFGALGEFRSRLFSS